MLRRLILAVLLTAAVAAPSFGAGPVKEFRGAWVTSWANGFLNPAEADATVRAAKDANINALFIEVRKIGDAYYKSNYEPRGFNKGVDVPADYDPLAYIIEKAHAQGIQVHAWLVTFRVWKGNGDLAPEGHVVRNHPEWLTSNTKGENRNSEGMYLDPGVPEARDYTVNVFLDVLKNYKVDGIHFDYVRYPGTVWGYNPISVARFNSAYGRTGTPDPKDPQWCQWRRDQVTEVVRRVYQGAREINPRTMVSASTIPWGDCKPNFVDNSPYNQVFQDWQSWMKEGIIDANVPMNYKDEGTAKGAAEYRRWLDGFVRWKYDRHVWAGQEHTANEKTVAQIKATRSRQLDGSAIFAFNASSKRDSLVAALRADVYCEPAQVPEMPWKLDEIKQASRRKLNEGLGYAAYKNGDLDKAVELIKAAIQDDPAFVEAHYRLGRCLLRKGDPIQARTEFEEALRLDPKYAPASKELAQLAKTNK